MCTNTQPDVFATKDSYAFITYFVRFHRGCARLVKGVVYENPEKLFEIFSATDENILIQMRVE